MTIFTELILKTRYNKKMNAEKKKIIGIILAAGKGTRINSHKVNKVCLPFNGKPLINYAVNLMQQVAEQTIIVVGAYSDSVKQVLTNETVTYVYQQDQLGTADAVKTAIHSLQKPVDLVLVGYGDHMMFYNPTTIQQLISLHQQTQASMSLISCVYDKPNELSWGRIIRNNQGKIIDSREQKDATEAEKKITELNAGFYCFDFNFLKANLAKVPRSPVSGEYYINSLVKIATDQGLTVSSLKVPFHQVGIGINNKEELQLSQALYHNIS